MNPVARTLLPAVAILATAVASADPAATGRPFAAPVAPAAASGPAAGLAQVTLSLLLVLGAVFAAAWLMRRLRGLPHRAGAGAIAVVAELAVGPRERVVLLDVAGERVLVGVAPGNVRALRSWPAGTGGPP